MHQRGKKRPKGREKFFMFKFFLAVTGILFQIPVVSSYMVLKLGPVFTFFPLSFEVLNSLYLLVSTLHFHGF